MTVSRASVPLVLAVPAYLTGVAVGTLIATAWNSGEDARGLVRFTARTLHRPSREIRARMAASSQPPPVPATQPDAA